MKTRIHFLDNLRTFLIFLILVLHSGLVYESVLSNNWIVIDPVQNNSIGLIRMYLDLFIMFVMFFISGYFIPFSIKNKSAISFLKSKFNRILLPWIIAVFTLIPIYKAIFLYSRGLPQEEWFSYFHLFQRSGTDLSFFANNPIQGWLWFLPVLFLFQMIYYALKKTNVLSVKLSLMKAVVLVFAIGLIYSMAISSMGQTGWFNSHILHFQNERLLIYFMAFLLGSLCNKLKKFESGRKNKKLYIISNIVLTISIGVYTAVALNLFFNMIDPARNYFFVSSIADRAIYYISVLLNMLSILYILIHVFRFNFNKVNKLMVQLNKNSYQVYIIHMIVIGVIALLMINLSFSAFVKFILLSILTFIFSNGIVYGHRILFKKNLALRLAIILPLLIAIFTIIYFVNNDDSTPDTAQTDNTPPSVGFHMAALQGDIDVVKQHIKAGSDLNMKDGSGASPLFVASTFGKTEVVKALIEAGAEVNFRKSDRSTPLHSAAFFCHTEIVEMLLEDGADKSLRNNSGSTAYESVAGSFESVKAIYDYFKVAFEPMGLKLDYEHIQKTRPIIAKMLL